ncbi:hypothetical protein BJF89_14190 [Corynebacterium sp. CNJ-954]|jgi:hypothetical protein|uniref:hypothetical protein n=1 Tax=Corynebacterium sp. CNJ-954 TaxID=1904962 RepID=UPI0009658285|nr:hypothetical protein [Corynebacterium sp. CNJ-954]OLT55653.1 hypothetical protein BJF89_14190 [Corynebacterium sp. CNJ-954]
MFSTTNPLGVLLEVTEGEFIYKQFDYTLTGKSATDHIIRARAYAFSQDATRIVTEDGTTLEFHGDGAPEDTWNGEQIDRVVVKLIISREDAQ